MPDIGKDLTVLLQKLMVGVSPPLTDWSDLLKSSSLLKPPSPSPVDPLKPAATTATTTTANGIDDKANAKVDDFNNFPKEVVDGKFYRLIRNTAKGRPLQYICFVDNKGTGTQAAVWADVQEKMVSVLPVEVYDSLTSCYSFECIQEVLCHAMLCSSMQFYYILFDAMPYHAMPSQNQIDLHMMIFNLITIYTMRFT